MPEFLRLVGTEQARDALLTAIDGPVNSAERVDSSQALGRVLSTEILAPHPLPEFPRSTVDGYAVLAKDTFGTSPSLPAYLRLRGEVPMGAPADFEIQHEECALIHTGGMLPAGANAVVMLEHAQSVGAGDAIGETNEIEVNRPVAPGENTIAIGEDVTTGQAVMREGTQLRPQEIGGLMALGITSVEVRRRPVIGIISSGDEIVQPSTRPGPGQVRDVNSWTLATLLEGVGAKPEVLGIVADDADALMTRARQAVATCDGLIISAGSSASARDLTASTINSLGRPGVLVHGISIRPGKPTILGACDGKAVIGLPGNPVSALVVARLFVLPVVDKLLGIAQIRPRGCLTANLSVNLASQSGREDWWPVKLTRTSSGGKLQWIAEPIFGRSNLIFNLVEADGLIRIPAERSGLSAGEDIEVEVF